MSNYNISPGMAGGYGPGLSAYDDGNSSSSSSDGSASAFEPEEAALEAAKEEDAGAQMPLPPMSLLHSNPEQFVMEFMFLPRPVRMREVDLEFYALSWEPITKRQLMRCCEYLSRRLSEIMNENVELERRVKNLGPRKTTVLTEDPYEVVTVEIMREEGWNRDDVVWCICEGMKKYPKELMRNQRFKTRLGLPVPGEDYEIVGGRVTTHATPEPAEDNEDDPVEDNTPKAPTKPGKPAPATKVGGVRRKTNKKRNTTASSSAAPKKASAAARKRTAKRVPNEDGGESEFNAADASPNKKRRSPMNRKPPGAAPIPSKPPPVTPPPKTSSALRNAAAGFSKQGAKPKTGKSGGSSKEGRVKQESNDDVLISSADDSDALLPNAHGSYGTFSSPDDADTSDNSGGSDDPADSDDSDKTITQDTYNDGLSEVSMGRA